jgi:hypothetical protein
VRNCRFVGTLANRGSRCGLPAAEAAILQRLKPPPRSEEKMISCPSGVQTGLWTDQLLKVICVGSPIGLRSLERVSRWRSLAP